MYWNNPFRLSLNCLISFLSFRWIFSLHLSCCPSSHQATHPNMRTYYFCTDTAKETESWMRVMTDAALVHSGPVKRLVRSLQVWAFSVKLASILNSEKDIWKLMMLHVWLNQFTEMFFSSGNEVFFNPFCEFVKSIHFWHFCSLDLFKKLQLSLMLCNDSYVTEHQTQACHAHVACLWRFRGMRLWLIRVKHPHKLLIHFY